MQVTYGLDPPGDTRPGTLKHSLPLVLLSSCLVTAPCSSIFSLQFMDQHRLRKFYQNSDVQSAFLNLQVWTWAFPF